MSPGRESGLKPSDIAAVKQSVEATGMGGLRGSGRVLPVFPTMPGGSHEALKAGRESCMNGKPVRGMDTLFHLIRQPLEGVKLMDRWSGAEH
jgi:hypothetical protein